MNASPVILAFESDHHTLAMRWATRMLGSEAVVAPSIHGVDPGLSTMTADRRAGCRTGVDSGAPRSIWMRRPRKPDLSTSVLPCDLEFVNREWLAFQDNVFSLAEESASTLWINKPTRAVRAENKLIQLRAARRVGLTFPDTLVTNDPAQVRAFIRRHGRVVFKTFSPTSWMNAASGTYFAVNITILDATSALSDESIALCPGIYQAYVAKTSDIRLTVIGDRCFAVRFRNTRGGAFLDWRAETHSEDMCVEPFAIPSALHEKIRSLMKELDLVFGCIDLVAGEDGELHFLEINQAGQFLFVEEMLPEIPMMNAMASMLIQARTDYTLVDNDRLSFARYAESDQHAIDQDLMAVASERRKGEFAVEP